MLYGYTFNAVIKAGCVMNRRNNAANIDKKNKYGVKIVTTAFCRNIFLSLGWVAY